jgi:hypothetical protein
VTSTLSEPATKKKRKRPSGVMNRQVWQGWLRFRQLPFSETFSRKMIDKGIFVSAVINEPGKRRGVRLIQSQSIDNFLQQLAAEQQHQQAETNP